MLVEPIRNLQFPVAADPPQGRCRRGPGNPRPRAFTLVELMVAMAVVGLLIGLLLPALSGARETANRVRCASNLHQLGLANMQYAAANEGRFVPAHTNFLRNLDRWHGRRAALDKPFDPAKGPLRPYLGADGAVKACPNFAGYLTGRAAFEAGCGGYGYNSSYIGSGLMVAGLKSAARTLPAQTTAIAAPERKLLFADAAFLAVPEGGGPQSPSGALGGPGDPSQRRLMEYSFLEPPLPGIRPSIHFRHPNRQANVCWADGHVTVIPFGHSAFGFEDFNIGWTGETPEAAMKLFVRD